MSIPFEQLRKPWDTYREPTVGEVNLYNWAVANHDGVKPRPILTQEDNERLRRYIEQRKLY